MTENYHTHTSRCHHATGTDEDYVQSAIAAGLTVLGFSDHTPFFFPGDYYSTFRMYPDQLQDYAKSILALKEKYRDQIEIRLGLEVEYYPDRMADLLTLIEPYNIEYMILGQHFCGNELDSPYNGTATDSEAHLKRYCNQLIAAMDTKLFSYVAHPDLVNFTGDQEIYDYHIRSLLMAAKERDIPMEINLLGVRGQRHYPNRQFWRIAGEVKCPVVIGSDAHRPEDVTDSDSEAIAMEMVEEYGLSLLPKVPIHSYHLSPLTK
jgi:histidinol-phosphatase (PHP family)